MTVFAVIAPEFSDLLKAAVEAKFAGAFHEVAPGQYLVSMDRATAQTVVEQLGASSGALGKIMVMPTTGIYGWHSVNMWNWMAAQNAPAPGGVQPGPIDG